MKVSRIKEAKKDWLKAPLTFKKLKNFAEYEFKKLHNIYKFKLSAPQKRHSASE